jgi:hypothetical protein
MSTPEPASLPRAKIYKWPGRLQVFLRCFFVESSHSSNAPQEFPMSFRMTIGIVLLAVGLGGVVAAHPPARSARAHGAVTAGVHGAVDVHRSAGNIAPASVKPGQAAAQR